MFPHQVSNLGSRSPSISQIVSNYSNNRIRQHSRDISSFSGYTYVHPILVSLKAISFIPTTEFSDRIIYAPLMSELLFNFRLIFYSFIHYRILYKS